MSAKLMGIVWELDVPHNYQLVLLALADHASDDGSSVYPGIKYLAWKTGYSERQVQRVLDKLEQMNLISAVAFRQGGGHNKTQWQLHLKNGVQKLPYISPKGRQYVTPASGKRGDKTSPLSSDNMSPREDDRGDISDTTGVTFRTLYILRNARV